MGKRYFSPITCLNLRRCALKVTKRIGKLGSGISQMRIIFDSPPLIGHVTRRMRSDRYIGDSNVIRLSRTYIRNG